MYISDITENHINELMNEISSFNDLPLCTYSEIVKELKNKKNFIELSFFILLFTANFELYPIIEFKDYALRFIEKNLDEMPLFLNDLSTYQWIPIIARWRLRINL